MTTPHKWAEVIHAFAEGKTIQYQNTLSEEWFDYIPRTPAYGPGFDGDSFIWRIKPQKKTYWMNVYRMGDYIYAGAGCATKAQCFANKNAELEYIKTISFDIEE